MKEMRQHIFHHNKMRFNMVLDDNHPKYKHRLAPIDARDLSFTGTKWIRDEIIRQMMPKTIFTKDNKQAFVIQ